MTSDFCDYNAYILVKSNIIITGCDLATELAFENCVAFTKYITKVDKKAKDDAEDLDLVMLL